MKKILESILAELAAQNLMLAEIAERALVKSAYRPQMKLIGENHARLAALVGTFQNEKPAVTPPAPPQPAQTP